MMDAYKAAREALSEFQQQDDYLLAHGASLMSADSHEILHVDTLRRALDAATKFQADEIERLRSAASQASFCLRQLLPSDADAQTTVAMLDAALGRHNTAGQPRCAATSAGVDCSAFPSHKGVR